MEDTIELQCIYVLATTYVMICFLYVCIKKPCYVESIILSIILCVRNFSQDVDRIYYLLRTLHAKVYLQ